jgi:Concanavalin A-like lectin/glucanases superfamily
MQVIFKRVFIGSVLFLLAFMSCQKDVMTPADIDYSLPEIKNISAENGTVLIGDTVTVSVEALNGESYAWSATGGTFTNAAQNPTNWIAPQEGGNYKITCTVTNSSGSREASVSINTLESLVPEGATAYWPFDSDFSEVLSGAAGAGGTDVSISSDAKIGDGAALFEGADLEIESALFYPEANAPMGPEDQFTISLWINTDDEGLGWLFGKTLDETYVEGGKGVYLESGDVVFDLSWIGEWRAEGVGVNDGEWHHIAVVKNDEEVLIYVDGEEAGGDVYEDWSSDEGTVVTIGAAWEEEGSDWPGTFQGLMDDVTFYDSALSAEEIAAIFENN